MPGLLDYLGKLLNLQKPERKRVAAPLALPPRDGHRRRARAPRRQSSSGVFLEGKIGFSRVDGQAVHGGCI